MNTFFDLIALIKIRLNAQMAYRKSFLIEILGHLLTMGSHIGSIFFVFYHVPKLGQWQVWEVLYLYGVASFAFSLAQLSAESFEDLSIYVKSGEFDQILLRPVSPLLQIVAMSFRIERLGGLIQSIAALVISCKMSHVFYSSEQTLTMLISVFSMMLIYLGLFLINGAFSFWTLENSEAFNAFTYGGVEVCKYPLSIYPKWMQTLFLFVVPLGFANFLPALAIFGKQNEISFSLPSLFIVPLVGFAFLIAALLFWRFSLKHYQSTGS